MSGRYKEWMITSFEVDQWEDWKKRATEDDAIKALAGQIEVCPDTDREHIQAMIRFHKSRGLDGVKKWLKDKTAHLEPVYGSIAQARQYCTKDESRADEGLTFEIGDFEEPKEKGQGQGFRTDFKCMMDAAKEGKKDKEIYEDQPGMLRYTRAVDTALRLFAPRERDKQDFEVICYWGDAGVGKTTKCKAICDENKLEYYEKDTDAHSQAHFFEGYNGQMAVIVNEADHLPYGSLLRLLSPETTRVMIKGGSVPFPANKILLTSNVHPKDWFRGLIDAKQCALIRRFDKIIELKRKSAVTNIEELLKERESVLELE